MISTRGRYALRVLIDIAEHTNHSYIPMKEIAERQQISKKYMEQIMPVLVRNNLVEGVHGAKGGYRLTKTPDCYTVYEILRLTELDLAPVACLADDAEPCNLHADCRTFHMWSKFDQLTKDYFSSVKLSDLMRHDV